MYNTSKYYSYMFYADRNIRPWTILGNTLTTFPKVAQYIYLCTTQEETRTLALLQEKGPCIIGGEPRHFPTLGVTVPNTINTHEFCPSIIPGSKFKIPSQYFAITFLAFLNSCQLLILFTCCFACIAPPTVSSTN